MRHPEIVDRSYNYCFNLIFLYFLINTNLCLQINPSIPLFPPTATTGSPVMAVVNSPGLLIPTTRLQHTGISIPTTGLQPEWISYAKYLLFIQV